MGYRGSKATTEQVQPFVWSTTSTITTHQRSVLTRRLLSSDNFELARTIGQRRCLFVLTPTVARYYKDQLAEYLKFHAIKGAEIRVLSISESSKTLASAERIWDACVELGLGRSDLIVAMGGGVCSDVSGMAAAGYRRGIPHVRVPTTLLGIVDAGLGVKSALNYCQKKNLLGSFHPPEACLLDPGFLSTLPTRHIRNGLAECVKLAIACNAALFSSLECHYLSLVETNFREPRLGAEEVLALSIGGMLEELSTDLFEFDGAPRAVDIGHTFSPHIESVSGFSTLHGEAVAIDLALTAVLARNLGMLAIGDCDRILQLIEALGLPLHDKACEAGLLWDSLSEVVAHRRGKLNLPIPIGIGECVYLDNLEDLDEREFIKSLSELKERSEA